MEISSWVRARRVQFKQNIRRLLPPNDPWNVLWLKITICRTSTNQGKVQGQAATEVAQEQVDGSISYVGRLLEDDASREAGESSQAQLRSLTSPGTVSSATAPGRSLGLTPKLSSMFWEMELRRPSSSLHRPPFWWLPTQIGSQDDKASRQTALATLAGSNTWHDGEAARVLRQRVEIEGQLQGEAEAILRVRVARGRREGAPPNPGLLVWMPVLQARSCEQPRRPDKQSSEGAAG